MPNFFAKGVPEYTGMMIHLAANKFYLIKRLQLPYFLFQPETRLVSREINISYFKDQDKISLEKTLNFSWHDE